MNNFKYECAGGYILVENRSKYIIPDYTAPYVTCWHVTECSLTGLIRKRKIKWNSLKEACFVIHSKNPHIIFTSTRNDYLQF